MIHHYIITLHPEPNEYEVAGHYEEMGAEITHVYHSALNGFSAYLSNELVEYASSDDRVKSVEHDGEPTLDAVQQDAPWALDEISRDTEHFNGLYEYDEDAEGVKIYIMDSGIRATHVEFEDRVVFGYGMTTPSSSHGTSVASSAAGKTVGVAKKATIVDVATSDSWANLIAGAEWILENHEGLGVVNLSISGESTSFDTAITNLVNAGFTVITSAGNDINVKPKTNTPSRVPGVLVVGASMIDKETVADYSMDELVRVFAPGFAVLAARSDNDTHYTHVNGTSFSCPFTAGVAAMILAANPGFTGQQVIDKIIELGEVNALSGVVNGAENRLLRSSGIGGSVRSEWSEPVSIAFEEPTGPVPNADAGPQQVVEYGSTVTLDASGSTDYDSIQWEQIAGTTVALSNVSALNPTFTAPATREQLRFRVTAMNANGTDFDEVIIGTAGVSIRTREQWGADESMVIVTPSYAAVQTLTLHHTADSRSVINSDYDIAMQGIMNAHVNDNGWDDVGYQFIIAPDGTIYEGRASGHDGDPGHNAVTNEHVVGSHVAGWNSGNVGISLMGDFTQEWALTAQYKALERLLADLCDRHGLDPEGTVDYVNPVTADASTQPTITEHNAWPGTATGCAGTYFRSRHPRVRYHVAVRMGKYTVPGPAVLAGLTPGPKAARVGPYRANDGRLFTVGMDVDDMSMFFPAYSEDDGLTWYEASGYSRGTDASHAFACDYDPGTDTMHLAFQAVNGWATWKPYDVAGDTWPAGAHIDQSPGIVDFAVDIFAKPNGDVMFAYQGAGERVRGARRIGGTWSATFSLDAGSTAYLAGLLYHAANDLAYVFYTHAASGNVRTIAIDASLAAVAPSMEIEAGSSSSQSWDVGNDGTIYTGIVKTDGSAVIRSITPTAPVAMGSVDIRNIAHTAVTDLNLIATDVIDIVYSGGGVWTRKYIDSAWTPERQISTTTDTINAGEIVNDRIQLFTVSDNWMYQDALRGVVATTPGASRITTKAGVFRTKVGVLRTRLDTQ